MKIRILPSEHKTNFHNSLEPNLWQNDQLIPEVRDALLKIAEDFSKFLKIPVIIDDIRLTGSLANYNYSQHSDIDLHIVINFSSISSDMDLVKGFFTSKRIVWNQKHDITVKGYEVEVYVEDIGEKHFSTGIYSITNDEWVAKPSPKKPVLDLDAATRKADHLKGEIDVATGPPQELADLKRMKEKIKRLRRCGLESGGEYSIENLAFKMLRRAGYLRKLNDAYVQEYDKNYSLPEEVKRT
jgi:hypothetical protein